MKKSISLPSVFFEIAPVMVMPPVMAPLVPSTFRATPVGLVMVVPPKPNEPWEPLRMSMPASPPFSVVVPLKL